MRCLPGPRYLGWSDTSLACSVIGGGLRDETSGRKPGLLPPSGVVHCSDVGSALAAFAAALASIWLGLGLGGPAAEAPPPADRPIEVIDRGYVSSRECASCHPGEHATWHR